MPFHIIAPNSPKRDWPEVLDVPGIKRAPKHSTRPGAGRLFYGRPHDPPCLLAIDGRGGSILLTDGVRVAKGASERSSASWGEIWPGVVAKRSRETGYRAKIIGSNAAKMAILTRLSLTEPGPGFMHFGMDWDAARFSQLTAEKYTRIRKGGFELRKFVLPRGRANEALDCTSYALAALQGWTARGNSLEKSKRYLDAARMMEPQNV